MKLEAPRYVFLNRAPGRAWNQNRPDSITESLLRKPLEAVRAGETGPVRLGLSFILSVLDTSPALLSQTLHRLLTLSEQLNIPVFIVLDGQNWWGSRSDLWNWFDTQKPGFDPANAQNVEWNGPFPTDAVKLAWRNWGRQIRVVPPPNLYAPRYRRALEAAFVPLAKQIADWQRALPPAKRDLFPGVKVGWEASIGINAYYYPNGNEQWGKPESGDATSGLDMSKDFAGGLSALGYAALRSSGRALSGPISLADHEFLAQGYLAFLAQMARSVGLAREQVFTHAGGQYAPWQKHYTHQTAVNKDSLPGWSLYAVTPGEAGDLRQAVQKAKSGGAWCAAEWLPRAKTAREWEDSYRATLGFENCRSVSVYNFEGIETKPEAVEGLRTFLHGV